MNNHLNRLLKQGGPPLLSYEFFPPKSDEAMVDLQKTIESLRPSLPDFVTITYGAGGSTRSRSHDVAVMLRTAGFSPVVCHLTCVGSTCDELAALTDQWYEEGFRCIMALRGDPPKGATRFEPPPDGLANARDLVTFLKQRHADFCCGVAGYPETHPEATSREVEMDYLRQKVDAGADFITTQLFFDNDAFFRFVEECRRAGITVPILPGLLPASSIKQVRRFTELCGATFPAELAHAMDAAGGEGPEAEAVGIAWCARQIDELLRYGTPGIHLYILNRARAACDPSLLAAMQRPLPPPL